MAKTESRLQMQSEAGGGGAGVKSDPDLQTPKPGPQNWPALHCPRRTGRAHPASSSGHSFARPAQQPVSGWRGWKSDGTVTRAIGVGAVGTGLAGAVVGFEEAWVAGWASGLHPRGGQLHCSLQVLTTDFWHGPFVHELCLQKWMKPDSALFNI